MFRPSDVFRNSAVVIRDGDKVLLEKKAMIFTPGEMVSVRVKADQLKNLSTDELTVSIERKS